MPALVHLFSKKIESERFSYWFHYLGLLPFCFLLMAFSVASNAIVGGDGRLGIVTSTMLNFDGGFQRLLWAFSRPDMAALLALNGLALSLSWSYISHRDQRLINQWLLSITWAISLLFLAPQNSFELGKESLPSGLIQSPPKLFHSISHLLIAFGSGWCLSFFHEVLLLTAGFEEARPQEKPPFGRNILGMIFLSSGSLVLFLTSGSTGDAAILLGGIISCIIISTSLVLFYLHKLKTNSLLWFTALAGAFSLSTRSLAPLWPVASLGIPPIGQFGERFVITLSDPLLASRIAGSCGFLSLILLSPFVSSEGDQLEKRIGLGKPRWLGFGLGSTLAGILAVCVSAQFIHSMPGIASGNAAWDFTSRRFIIIFAGSFIGALIPLLGFDQRGRPEAWGWRLGLWFAWGVSLVWHPIGLLLFPGIAICLISSMMFPLMIERIDTISTERRRLLQFLIFISISGVMGIALMGLPSVFPPSFFFFPPLLWLLWPRLEMSWLRRAPNWFERLAMFLLSLAFLSSSILFAFFLAPLLPWRPTRTLGGVLTDSEE